MIRINICAVSLTSNYILVYSNSCSSFAAQHCSPSTSNHIRIRSDLVLTKPFPYVDNGNMLDPMNIVISSFGSDASKSPTFTEVPCFFLRRPNGYCSLIKDGFSFNRYSQHAWQCSRYLRLRCRARVRFQDNEYKMVNGEHIEECRNSRRSNCQGTVLRTELVDPDTLCSVKNTRFEH